MKSILNKGRGSDFSQQKLFGYQPLITPVAIIVILLSCSILFIPMGLALLDAADQNVMQKMRYDNIDGCKISESTPEEWGKVCYFTMTIEKDMKAPIYFFYEINGFYQNHRKYVSSKSDSQLRNSGSNNNVDCKPILKYNSNTINPCGLVARSIFLDRFSVDVIQDNQVTSLCNVSKCNVTGDFANTWNKWHDNPNWEQKKIAWRSDLNEKFVLSFKDNLETRFGERQNLSGIPLPDNDNKDLVVWMRIAALKDFRKLYRVIRQKDLRKGDKLNITAVNWFTVDKFNGKKKVSIGTTTWAGLQNKKLAWALISAALCYIGLAIIFATALLIHTRKLAEVNRFNWSNRPQQQNVLDMI